MSVIYLMLPIALLLGIGFTIAFIWMTFTGQYDDLDTPQFRILVKEEGHDERIHIDDKRE